VRPCLKRKKKLKERRTGREKKEGKYKDRKEI
jgi:hypothetical protein